MAGQAPSMEQFEAFFQRADVDRDGRISGKEAVAFLQGSNLPRQVLAQIWTYADQNRTGFLGRPEFFNALKLVTVAQSKRDLTPDLVKAALFGPASAKIPAPQINLAATQVPQSNVVTGASPAPSGSTSSSSQGSSVSGPYGFSAQQNQITKPPRPALPGSGIQSQPGVSSQVMPGIGSMSAPQASNRSLTPSAAQGGFGPVTSSITQPKTPGRTGLHSTSPEPITTSSLSPQVGQAGITPSSATGNGFASNSAFGDVFSATPSQPKLNSAVPTYSAGGIPPSSAGTLTSSKDQPIVRPSAVSQRPPVPPQRFQPTGPAKQHGLAPNSPSFPAAGNLPPAQSQPPWPRMTQADVQKYSKVFMQVDTDRDGKITGEQARNLFLSWRLPREVLKQVWDLSDQDNDSMLSLREFCIALYLMERYREGRPLPTVLPNSMMFDESLLPAFGQTAAVHGNTSWRPTPGYQQPQGTKNARPITSVGGGKPPRPVPVPQPDEPVQQKPKVPVLEKHVLDQLSTEEQDSLNKKFEEAKDAEKKVQELEKDILEAKQKIQFFHAKMQELVLYKSRCDNRLNEITEKVVGDKKEAELLAKKYEEKYKQSGDVASKLTIEEATFRDIQEKKMELYRAIVKLEQANADGIQDRANEIQSDLEELVKALNERCKTYGLRGKPTSLVELPFGWQPGIQEAAADWDEVWDKLEDEGFTFVKELSLEVQNVVAPPKPKTPLIREKVTSLVNGGNVKSPSEAGDKSPENERPDMHNSEQPARSPPDSPAGIDAIGSPSKQFHDLQMPKDFSVSGSPHAFDTKSEFGGAESVLSGDKGFDEPGWGSFDTHYDSDAAWDFKDTDHERRNEGSLFGPDDWGLNPIKTGSRATDSTLPKQGPFFDSVPSTPLNQGPFFDSVPSTPFKQGPFFDSVPSTPLYNSTNSPQADNMFTRNSPFAFADSVPSTPMYNSSPRKFSGESAEEQYSSSFDSFSRFDSFNMNDSGPFGSRDSFSRFDSMRSTRDSDFDQGHLARFDSFRSTADSDYNFGQPRESFTRFDSMRSTRDSVDYGYGFPSFDDPADPFGSGDPFKSSTQTPRTDTDGWKAF